MDGRPDELERAPSIPEPAPGFRLSHVAPAAADSRGEAGRNGSLPGFRRRSSRREVLKAASRFQTRLSAYRVEVALTNVLERPASGQPISADLRAPSTSSQSTRLTRDQGAASSLAWTTTAPGFLIDKHPKNCVVSLSKRFLSWCRSLPWLPISLAATFLKQLPLQPPLPMLLGLCQPGRQVEARSPSPLRWKLSLIRMSSS